MMNTSKQNAGANPVERIAAGRVFTFQMIRTVSVTATFALNGGASAPSR